MPFYEYECSSCKFYVETMQKVSDPPLKKCPSCGRSALKKLISAPVFRLKGSGWYETDFKSDKENKRNLVEEGAKEEAPAETKPEKGEEKSKTDAKEAKDVGKGESKSKPGSEAKVPVRSGYKSTRPSTGAVSKPGAVGGKAKPKAAAAAARKASGSAKKVKRKARR